VLDKTCRFKCASCGYGFAEKRTDDRYIGGVECGILSCSLEIIMNCTWDEWNVKIALSLDFLMPIAVMLLFVLCKTDLVGALSGGQGSERRDNLAYESNASRMRKALSMMAARG
jgi:uncharacterized protein (DUF983 family)